MVDCSHANTNKQPELQPLVVENVANQIIEGNKSIVGLMVESHINAGNQSIPVKSGGAGLRRVCYRRLHRLGNNREVSARDARQGKGHTAEARSAEVGLAGIAVIGHIAHANQLR